MVDLLHSVRSCCRCRRWCLGSGEAVCRTSHITRLAMPYFLGVTERAWQSLNCRHGRVFTRALYRKPSRRLSDNGATAAHHYFQVECQLLQFTCFPSTANSLSFGYKRFHVSASVVCREKGAEVMQDKYFDFISKQF